MGNGRLVPRVPGRAPSPFQWCPGKDGVIQVGHIPSNLLPPGPRGPLTREP